MNPLMEQLKDIDGLDPISMWPLAIGWWVLIGFSLIVLGLLIYYAVSWIIYKCSWKNDSYQKLLHLEKNLSEASARETVIALSEYLRRIALQRYPRKECASLMGEEWLKWLASQDPKKFDWEKHEKVLVEAPYAPRTSNLSLKEIKELIQAVKNWVR